MFYHASTLFAFLTILTMSAPANATPEIVVADDVSYADCRGDVSCKGQLVNAMYESLKQEVGQICTTRGYASYHIRRLSSKTVEPTVVRITVYGNCRAN